MMKPISTFGQTALRNSNLRRLEGELAIANQEVATGMKNDVAKSLGSELINLQTIRNQFGENESYLRSMSIYQQRWEMMDGGLAEVEDAVNRLVEIASVNGADALDSASSVRLVAEGAVERIITGLNVQIGGRFLFGGQVVDRAPLQSIDNINPNPLSGISPRQAIADAVAGTGPAAPLNSGVDQTVPLTIADTEDLLDRMNGIFDGTNAATPGLEAYSFENTFFNGELAGLLSEIRLPGNAYETLDNQELVDGLRDVMQGAWILASVDLEAIDDDAAYQRLMTGDADPALGLPDRDGALDMITRGLAAIQRTRANMGLSYQVVKASEEATLDQNAVFNKEIIRLERADPYETQSRFLDIEKQLEASYAATSRVMSLNLWNFIR
ncbi:MAG: flagellin [Parvularcula sp.]|jgi:flagellar hook-associated protein 3 FlgL|nr:flagellin [Parvularcula sp.]